MSEASENNGNLLEVSDLKTWFAIKRGLLRKTVGHIRAVDGVSFGVRRGQTFGLVGESGCGKTTVAKSIVRLVKATSGKVRFKDIDVLNAQGEDLKLLRREVSLIFQDPYGSLNPRMTVGNIVGEPVRYHSNIRGAELSEEVTQLLSKVGLSADHVNRYPHEFSGGQRQRIGVARALSVKPELVICDEPVSALDVSIQSQILNLLKDLQDELGLTYLFIAHDLAVVQFACDVIGVMYLGRMVEFAGSEQLYRNPLHPYTKALMSAIPVVDPFRRGKRLAFGGEVPSAVNPPSGCPFHPRCPLAEGICMEKMPGFAQSSFDEGHFVACWKCEVKSSGQVADKQ